MKTRTCTYLCLAIAWVIVLGTLTIAWIQESKADKVSLLVPFRTFYTHEVNPLYTNSDTLGLGLGYKTDSNYIFGIGKLKRNAEFKRSTYGYAGYETTGTINYGVSLGYGTNYPHFTEEADLLYPEFSIRYKYLKVTTSYPFSEIYYKDSDITLDFINLQLVIPVY